MRIALGLLLALVLAAPAAAQRASLPDIEDEVMCAECGTALNVSASPVADEQRDFIRGLIAQGKTKEEVKAALVEEYGPAILALPEDKGVSVGVYAVPALLALLGLLAVGLTARRWRRAGAAAPAAAGPPLDPGDAQRLDAELARFDG